MGLARCGILFNSPSLTGWSCTQEESGWGPEIGGRRVHGVVGAEVTGETVCRMCAEVRATAGVLRIRTAPPECLKTSDRTTLCGKDGDGSGPGDRVVTLEQAGEGR